jgi:hypothetical protein
MPTVLDELVVKLGIDNRGFDTDVAKTQVALGKTGALARRESRSLEEHLVKAQTETSKRIQQVEHVGRQAAQQFQTLSNHVLGLLGTLAGAYSLTQFVKGIVTTDAAIGRLSKMLGISTEELSAWQGAAEQAGGAADDVNQSFMSLSQEFQRLQATGHSSITPFFEAMHIPLMDKETGQLRQFRDIMGDLADFASKHSGPTTTFWLNSIGISPGMIPLLMQGREELQKTLDKQKELGLTRQQDADAAQALQRSYNELTRAVTRLGASILTEFSPAILTAINAMRDWVLANKNWRESDIGEYVLKAVDIFKQFVAGVEEVVKVLGGWENATKIILGLWVATKVAPILTFLAQFTGMVVAATGSVTALGTSMAALTIPPWFASLMRLGAFGAAAMAFTGAAGGEDAEFSKQKNDEYLRQNPSGTHRSFFDFMLGRPGKNTFSPTADAAMPPEQRAFLDALSRGESSGDYGARNPNSTAHGRYQFIDSTDAEVSAKTALPGQDPVSQDRKAWFLASRTYMQSTGRDLGNDLKSGGHEAQIASALNRIWPSLPGGSQQNTSLPDWLNNLRSANMAYQNPPALGVTPQIGGSVGPLGAIDQNPPALGVMSPGPLGAIDPGRRFAFAPPSTSNDNSRTSSVETNINGPINVQTNATDADGVARGLGSALQRYSYVPQVNSGLV